MGLYIWRICMHNLLSRSQFTEWRHFENTVDELDTNENQINDYYECLIECDMLDQKQCKQVCKSVFM